MRILILVLLFTNGTKLFSQNNLNLDFLATLSVLNIEQAKSELADKGFDFLGSASEQYLFSKSRIGSDSPETLILYPKSSSKRNDVVYSHPSSHVIDALCLSHISQNREYELMSNFKVGENYQHIFERVIKNLQVLILFSANHSSNQFSIAISYN